MGKTKSFTSQLKFPLLYEGDQKSFRHRLPFLLSQSKLICSLIVLFFKYTFQTYGVLMVILFGFYYYDVVELNDELMMVSHVCLFGSIICAILFVMQKTLIEQPSFSNKRVTRLGTFPK